ncbi:MAG: MFS transporter, partial [bacterium]
MVILPQRYLILFILNGVYFFVYFHRVSTAVLAPYLIEAFSASATSLGAMSSAYFYPYALSQPIVGFLADRWGAKKVITFSTLISFLGAFLFALAGSLIWAAFARALIGFGAAGVFVPALKILLPWFGARAFARMNTILLAVGNMGAIVASTPYAWFIQQVGWRNSFFFIAGLSLFLFFLSWQFVKDAPEAEIRSGKEMVDKKQSQAPGFFEILKSPFYWLMAALFFAYGGP